MTMSHPTPFTPAGARLVDTQGKTLPLSGCALTVTARGGLARVVLEQRFENPHDEALSLTYSLPLPADAAVSGFSFQVGDELITGEIERRAAARERFERALVSGHSAALLEQERSSLFTQEIGNVPPRATVIARVELDQPLVFRAEGAWEWRFPLAAAPRYLGAAGRVADAASVTLDVASAPTAPRCRLSLLVDDELADGRSPESPSHPLSCRARARGADVELGSGGAVPLDRDVVVRWPVARPSPSDEVVSARSSRPGAGAETHGLLTLVPPDPDVARAAVGRDLILLLDVSGSMGGEPLEQARRVSMALVDSLTEADSLEMVAFSSRVTRWRSGPIQATAEIRREAMGWLGSLVASGGTEMLNGILEALASVRPGAQRQVILVTDGLIGFESEVVGAILERLPASSRLHALGVGSSVNRSLLGPAARAGHGVEAIVGIGEDPEHAARQLLARTRAPLVVDLAIEGDAVLDVAPRRLPDLFAGAPALVALQLRPEGGALRVRGRTPEGSFVHELRVEPSGPGAGGEAIATYFARQRIEDLELERAAGGPAEPIDAAIEDLSLRYQVQSRLTSWIAVSRAATVDPSRPSRRERLPQNVPFGMQPEAFGFSPMAMAMPAMATRSRAMPMPPAMPGMPPPAQKARMTAIGRSAPGSESAKGKAEPPPPPRAPAPASFEEKAPAPPLGARSAPPVGDRLARDDESDLGAPAAEGAAPPARAAGPARLGEAGAIAVRGVIRLQTDDELVLELTFDEDADWDPAGLGAFVETLDGALIGAVIDHGATTARARVSAGQSIRVVLRRQAEPLSASLSFARLVGAGRTWVVQLGG